jgi:hypothetical protein
MKTVIQNTRSTSALIPFTIPIMGRKNVAIAVLMRVPFLSLFLLFNNINLNHTIHPYSTLK